MGEKYETVSDTSAKSCSPATETSSVEARHWSFHGRGSGSPEDWRSVFSEHWGCYFFFIDITFSIWF